MWLIENLFNKWSTRQFVFNGYGMFGVPGFLCLIAAQVKSICKGLHVKVFAKRALEHYCAQVSLKWSGRYE